MSDGRGQRVDRYGQKKASISMGTARQLVDEGGRAGIGDGMGWGRKERLQKQAGAELELATPVRLAHCPPWLLPLTWTRWTRPGRHHSGHHWPALKAHPGACRRSPFSDAHTERQTSHSLQLPVGQGPLPRRDPGGMHSITKHAIITAGRACSAVSCDT
jgi:hypothetical protein